MNTTTPSRLPNPAAAVVTAFGGPTKLSGLLGGAISPQAVSNWSQRGSIPGGWHLRLLRLAEREGVSLAPGDLADLDAGEAA